MVPGFHLDRRFAQTLVDSIAAELNKNVIIMDGQGVIIASFDRERIGQVHEAAARMLSGGCLQEVAVSQEDVRQLDGVREGFSVPILYAGSCVGVIGVTGNAGESAPYARLAARFVGSAIEANSRQEQLTRIFQGRRSLQSALLSKLITIQEEERKRVSRELHDEIGQLLTSTLVSLRVLSEKIDREDLRSSFAELRELTACTLEAVRSLAVDLRPMLLDDMGLSAAVRKYTERFSKQHSIAVHIEDKEFAGARLPAEVELSLYRIIQEALTNAAKHSAAGQITIEISKKDSRLHILIRDKGRGFDSNNLEQRRDDRLGLFGMRERVALMGGQLLIESAIGQGTTISVVIPV